MQKKNHEIRGRGYAETTRIYNEAFKVDEEFFKFHRFMKVYSKSFAKDNTKYVLSSNNNFVDILTKGQKQSMKSKAFILLIFAYFLIAFSSYANLFTKIVENRVCKCNKLLTDIVEELIATVVNISNEQILKHENNNRTKISFTPRNNFFDNFKEFF